MADLERLRNVEQALHAATVQRQALESQEDEIASAKEHIGQETYKIVGNLMVKTTQDAVEKELAEKHERVRKQIAKHKEQEQKLSQELQTLKKEVLDD